MQPIEAFEDYTERVQKNLNEILLSQRFGLEETLSVKLCELRTSTPAQGGLSVPNLKAEAPLKHAA